MKRSCFKGCFCSKGGFTLIELLVVVLIIGILAAVALPQYQKAVAKTRYMELVSIGETLRRAEEIHYLQTGDYTNQLEELDVDIPAGKFEIDLRPTTGGRPYLTIGTVDDKLGLSYKTYFDNIYGSSSVIAQGCRLCRVTLTREESYLSDVCLSLTGKYAGNDSSYRLYPFSRCDTRYE